MKTFITTCLSCLFFLPLCAQADPFHLRVIHTNDLHAHLIPFDNNNNDCTFDSCLGGFARIKTFIDTNRDESTLVLDAGDRFSGSIFYTINKSKNIADLMQQMKYDAMAIGNHDFDDGIKELTKFSKNIHTPLLASNIIFPRNSFLSKHILPALVFHKKNRQIGVIGITTPKTKTSTANAQDVAFIEPIDAILPIVKKMKEQGVNIIILLNHNGLVQDKKLAQSLTDIDIIINAHSHSLLSNNPEENPKGPYPLIIQNPDNKPVLIVSTGMGGQHVGLLDINFDEQGEILSFSGNSVPMDTKITPNESFNTQITTIQKALFKKLNEPVNHTKTPLTLTQNQNFCSQSCYIGEILTTLLLKGAQEIEPQVKIAFLNGGSIRSGIPTGGITYQHLAQTFPFDSKLVIAQMSGSEIRAYLQHGIRHYLLHDRTNALLHPAGLRYSFNENKEITSIQIDGKDLNDTETFLVALPSFIANGGDEFPKLKALKQRKSVRAILLKMLKKTPSLPAFENRVLLQE